MWLHPETMIKLGNEFFEKKEYEQATNWYEQSIKKNAQFVEGKEIQSSTSIRLL